MIERQRPRCWWRPRLRRASFGAVRRRRALKSSKHWLQDCASCASYAGGRVRWAPPACWREPTGARPDFVTNRAAALLPEQQCNRKNQQFRTESRHELHECQRPQLKFAVNFALAAGAGPSLAMCRSELVGRPPPARAAAAKLAFGKLRSASQFRALASVCV